MGARSLAAYRKTSMEKIKKILLSLYVITGVALILLVWYQGINVNTTTSMTGNKPTEPYYAISTVTPMPEQPFTTLQSGTSHPTDETSTVFPTNTSNVVSSADATATFIQMGIDE